MSGSAERSPRRFARPIRTVLLVGLGAALLLGLRSVTFVRLPDGPDGRLDAGQDDALQVVVSNWGSTPVHRLTLELQSDRDQPPVVRIVLHPEEGSSSLALSLRDTEDRGIEGATLQIDGQDYGTSGPGGGLQIDGRVEYVPGAFDIGVAQFFPGVVLTGFGGQVNHRILALHGLG